MAASSTSYFNSTTNRYLLISEVQWTTLRECDVDRRSDSNLGSNSSNACLSTCPPGQVDECASRSVFHDTTWIQNKVSLVSVNSFSTGHREDQLLQSHLSVNSYNIETNTWAKRKQRFTKVHWSVLCEIREIRRSSMNSPSKQPMNIVRNAYLKDLIAPSRRNLQPELGHKVLSSAELAPPPLLHAVHCFQQ